ncbi:MAG: NAD(P)H-binding protein [Candidatus Neomarinimicrobiota bacterium]
MKVALLGGTGFVGSYLVEELLERGHEPVLLVRPGSEGKVSRRLECTLISGNVGNQNAIFATLEGCDAVIYSIGIIRQFERKGITYDELHFQGAKRAMDAAVQSGIKRFILMSANGVKPDGTPYQKTKYQAEQFLKTTGLEWTIFRPSLIFGDPRGKMEFCTQLRDGLIRLPIPAPLFYRGLWPINAGMFKMSPVHVKDVAAIFVKALAIPETIGQTYALGGPTTLNWKTLIQIVGDASGKHKWTIPTPVLIVKAAAVLLDRFDFFPITRDQIEMLVEGNTCDSTEVFQLFSIEPQLFTPANLSYLKRA